MLIHGCLYSGGLIFGMLCALVICGLLHGGGGAAYSAGLIVGGLRYTWFALDVMLNNLINSCCI